MLSSLRSKTEVMAAVGVALFWKFSRTAVLVAVPGLTNIKGVLVAPELRTVNVVWPREAEEDALKKPATCRVPAIVEEAEEMKPPVRVERLVTPRVLAVKVEEAFNPPVMVRLLAMVEEALEINPLRRLAKLEKALIPPTVKVEEAFNGPAIWRLPAIVEEAEEIKPFSTDNVPLALNRETSVKKPFCKVEKVRAP